MQRVRSTKVQTSKPADCLGCELPIDLTLLNGCSEILNSESQDGVLKVLNPRLPSTLQCVEEEAHLGHLKLKENCRHRPLLNPCLLSTAGKQFGC